MRRHHPAAAQLGRLLHPPCPGCLRQQHSLAMEVEARLAPVAAQAAICTFQTGVPLCVACRQVHQPAWQQSACGSPPTKTGLEMQIGAPIASLQPCFFCGVRSLFLLALRRCTKYWHMPFSASRIEGQMEVRWCCHGLCAGVLLWHSTCSAMLHNSLMETGSLNPTGAQVHLACVQVLQRGFECRRELGASFSALILVGPLTIPV